MKAAQIKQYGDPSVIEINEVDKPVISEGKVLIEVHASSINPFDGKIRAGYMKDMIPLEFPTTLGGDVAGKIVEIADDIIEFKVGDKVYGQAQVVAGASGAFAEYTATAANQIAKMPTNLDFKQAASLPLVGISALQGMTEHINLQPDQRIFIHGGAGGIGTIAIQIAKHIGAYVATTATGDNIELVKSLGADEVIDYTSQDFATELHNFDAVFDTVGGDDATKVLDVLKRDGVAVSMAGQADETRVSELGIRAFYQMTHITKAKLEQLNKLVEENIVKPQVDKEFTLSNIQQAFEALENGSIQGKVIVTIR